MIICQEITLQARPWINFKTFETLYKQAQTQGILKKNNNYKNKVFNVHLT